MAKESTEKKPKEAKKTGISVGLKRGHITKARVPAKKPNSQHGRLTERTKFVREIVQEVAGFAPYEKRLLELLRTSQDKRARKFAKKRLGTLRRAKNKIDSLSNVIAQTRR